MSTFSIQFRIGYYRQAYTMRLPDIYIDEGLDAEQGAIKDLVLKYSAVIARLPKVSAVIIMHRDAAGAITVYRLQDLTFPDATRDTSDWYFRVSHPNGNEENILYDSRRLLEISKPYEVDCF